MISVKKWDYQNLINIVLILHPQTEELEGYTEYTNKVKKKSIPRIW